MINHSTSNFSAENMGQVLLNSVSEAIGTDYLDKVIDQKLASNFSSGRVFSKVDASSSLRAMSVLQMGLEQAYGYRGGQGLALLAGRNFFDHAMRSYGGRLGFSSNTFQLKSLRDKMGYTLHAVAGWFNQFSDHQVVIEETGQSIYWRLKRCPFCWERQEKDPICHFTIGVLQAGLYWASGGKIYPVEETACLACGDPECLIEMGRSPLE